MKTTLKALLAIFTITSGLVLHTTDPSVCHIRKSEAYAIISFDSIDQGTDQGEKLVKEYVVPITKESQNFFFLTLYEKDKKKFEKNYKKIIYSLEPISNILNQQTETDITDEKRIFKLKGNIKNFHSIVKKVNGAGIILNNGNRKTQSIVSQAKSVLGYITPRVFPTTLAIAQFLMAINQIKSISYYWAGKN